jgi:hypothetical protein
MTNFLTLLLILREIISCSEFSRELQRLARYAFSHPHTPSLHKYYVFDYVLLHGLEPISTA